jgi:hypothetical protein
MAASLLIELRDCDFREDVEETLTGLPADLFGIYTHFLTRATNIPRRTIFIQAIFRWLVFSARELTSNELADALAFPLADPKFDFSNPAESIYDPNRRGFNSDIFKLLEGLIVIQNGHLTGSSITFAHSSVKDYILSQGFLDKFCATICLTKQISHKFLAQTCVRYLLLFADPKHSITQDTLSDYPFALYAAKYWLHHIQLCDDQNQDKLLPSILCLLEDESSQYSAFYQLHYFNFYGSWPQADPIPPSLCVCSEMGYIEGVRSLLIRQNASVDQATEDGRTALHLALENGHLDIARLLIEHNASVDQATKDGQTALHLASLGGHLNIVRLLIEHNASVSLATNNGWTARHLATNKGHSNIARLLLEHSASVDG